MPHLARKNGFSLIELLLVIFIANIIIVGIFSFANYSLKIMNSTDQKIKAVYLLKDMLEGVRSLRDESWQNVAPPAITIGADYYPVQAGVSPNFYWQLVAGMETVEGVFSRKVVFENVSRDASKNIEAVYNPANDDPNTKKVRATVSWIKDGAAQQVEALTLITNWR